MFGLREMLPGALVARECVAPMEKNRARGEAGAVEALDESERAIAVAISLVLVTLRIVVLCS